MIRRKSHFIRARIATLRWFVGLFLFFFAYWWVMSNYIIRDFWDPQYAMKEESLRTRLKEYPGHPLWLIMGTSHVERGLRLDILEAGLKEKDAPLFYNFGLGAAGLFRQYICLKRLVEDGIKPRRVVVEIVGATMSRELFAMADVPHLLVRARRDEFQDYLDYSTQPEVFRSVWERSRWDPTYKYGMRTPNQTLAWRLIPLPGISMLEKQPYDKWGWYPEKPAPIPEPEYQGHFELARGQFADKFENFEISKNTDHALKQIIELCKKEGIDLTFVRMPEWRDFQAFYTPESNLIIDQYLTKLSADYQVPIINARDWMEKVDYTDGHHLNATGAEKFTRRFTDLMLSEDKNPQKQ